jgi:hypothetical protein
MRLSIRALSLTLGAAALVAGSASAQVSFASSGTAASRSPIA